MQSRLSALFAGVALAVALPSQSPCFDLNIGTDLALTDDSTAQGLALGFSFNFGGASYTDICVCSNGFLWLGPTSVLGGDFSPSEAELLAGAPRILAHWMDFNPGATGSGHVYFNSVAAQGGNPAYALVTWAGVYEFGRTTPIDMQIKLDANHQITVTYGTTPPQGGTTNTATGTMLGASTGNGATANPVTFATRPLTVTSSTFHEVLAAGTFNLAGVQLGMFSTPPGYTIADLTCTPNTLPGPAQYLKFGQGCPRPATMYETFGAGTIDLSNTNFACIPNGVGGYVVVQGAATPFFTGFTNNLAGGDDTTHVVALPFPFTFQGVQHNQIVVSSNGFIWLDAVGQGSGCCTGDAAGLLAGQPRIAAHWTDLFTNPGGLFADLDPATGEFCITWNNVAEFNASGASNTFQIALKPSGIFDLRYQGITLISHTSLTGFSGGNGAADPGPIDISAITQIDTGPAGTPLDLHNVAGSLPRFGQNVNLEVSGLSANGSVAFLALCFVEATPPIDMTFVGAPNCLTYLAFLSQPVATMVAITGGQPTAPFTFGVPNNPALAGTQLFNQSLGQDATANALGFKFSNAVKLTVGL